MKKYKLRYLPLFEEDLYNAASYIADVLKNPQAAERLITKTKNAIKERQKMPLSFEPYHSAVNRKDQYYRIYIGNYSVFYVVIDDVMEVRRFIYSARYIDRIL